jgi:hypothetical protein
LVSQNLKATTLTYLAIEHTETVLCTEANDWGEGNQDNASAVAGKPKTVSAVAEPVILSGDARRILALKG